MAAIAPLTALDAGTPSAAQGGEKSRSHRIPARDLIHPELLTEVRQRPTWRGLWMIGHAWVVIIGAIALVAAYPNPLTFLVAVMLIGSRQLGLAILMHDGAHGNLAANPDLNLRISQWFCAYPILAETRGYRKYHLQHHAHTQTDDDPDLVLSAPFPITANSYRRKFLRDLTGQTGFQQRRAQIVNALGPPEAPMLARLSHLVSEIGPQLATQALIFGVMALAGVWWAYPLLWVLPLITWFMVITRVRNIAEHAVVPDSTDPLRNTRTTKANLIERALVAPYFVNYHLEHHLFYYIPAYNLPKIHQALMAGPHANRMEVQPNYWTVMKSATAKANAEDKPGELVSNVRRRAAGTDVDKNSAASGF